MLIESIKKEKFIFSIVGLGAVGFVLALPFFLWNDVEFSLSAKLNAEKVAQFGDFIGGVFGSIWALAGIFLFYKALTEQRADFKNNKKALDLQVQALQKQIEEFQLSRDEQVLSRKVYEEQSKTLKTQQFESNFYSLLNVYLNIKNNLSHDNSGFFKEISKHISSGYSVEDSISDNNRNLIDKYYHVYSEHREALSSYFRSLYRIFNIINTAPNLNEKERMFYAKIIRGQLSDFELIVLYYNSKSHYGEKVQRHILNYNLLKHLPLSCKPEFKLIFEKQVNNTLEMLSGFVTKFLVNNVNYYYDVEFNKLKIEERSEDTNIIFGIYFENDLEFKFYTDFNLKNNNLNISIEEFDRFSIQLIYEMCVARTYLIESRVTLKHEVSELSGYRVLNITLNTQEQININKDKH